MLPIGESLTFKNAHRHIENECIGGKIPYK